MGMEDIPEESVRSAIVHIQRIITGLDKLKMFEQQQEKTSSAIVHNQPNHVGGRLATMSMPAGFTR